MAPPIPRILNRLKRVRDRFWVRTVRRGLRSGSPYHQEMYAACRQYVDRFCAQNNDNMTTNGELRLSEEILPHCNVVFDVGANVGDWSATALQINPGIQLHCFEPSQGTFSQLISRLGSRAKCNHFGLSSREGKCSLFVQSGNIGNNSLYQRQGLQDGWGIAPPTATELVDLDTLDAYCKRDNLTTIDFLKVDVEGHELEVFRGGQEMFSRGRVKHVQFEYGGCNIDAHVLLKDILKFFEGMPYAFYKVFPEQLCPVTRYDQRLENFQYQNWLIKLTGQ